MAFLSGVLGAVKNENEVTTYDKYMTNKLETVISTLNSKIGSGRAGLVESVGAVKEWLEGYEGMVSEKINEVKHPIESIKDEIKRHKNKIREEEEFHISDQISNWTGRAVWYIEKAQKANTALEKIDNLLFDKLNHNVKLVLQGVTIFLDDAMNKDLENIYNTTETQMMQVLDEIYEIVENKNKAIQWYLRKHFTHLHEKFKKFNAEKLGLLKNVINEDIGR
ncbi:hypothetical protein, conserved, partial [Babesia bigemina]